ncbi:MAG: hypothetical protein BWK73_49665 [Thiothrix lacustris]|uniref:DUF2442 domain-containing protein n=1 Tax=Thiothrix lacustris TaxID=525917 RepID=A0A1Y1Q908_9GAMM|nr:MAG: hypothetical protein BWK73_49665 [Thiothrix lacustris]
MNTLIKGKAVHLNDQYLTVELDDGRVISTPMNWYKELQAASFTQLKNYQFICQRTGIEWAELDYQLSIESMLVAMPLQQAA